MSDVETHLSDIVSTAMKAKDDIASMVDKYRPGTGTVKLLPTGLHDSGPHLFFQCSGFVVIVAGFSQT